MVRFLILYLSCVFRCFTLFDELDQISTRFTKLQTDIIKRYTSTCIEYKDDTDINVVNSMVQPKPEELLPSEQENDKSFNDDDENSEKSSIALNEVNYEDQFFRFRAEDYCYTVKLISSLLNRNSAYDFERSVIDTK